MLAPVMTRLPCRMVAFALIGGSCVPSVDIPEPPNMQPLLLAYAAPTANVGPDVMTDWADVIADARQAIEESALSEQLLVLVERTQAELHSSGGEEGTIVVNGVPVPQPFGVIRLDHVCSGWDEGAEGGDPEFDGSIELTMTLEQGLIGSVVWGIFDKCRWRRTLGSRSLEVEYDGEIRAHFGGSFGTGTPARDRAITFDVNGTALIDGEGIPIRRSFRLAPAGEDDILDGRLDILIGTEEEEFFVFFFRARDFATGVHDETGRFFCSLEKRECASQSGIFSW